MRPRGSVPSAFSVSRVLAGAAALVLLAGCSTSGDTDDLPTREPVVPAVAPTATTPDGRVLPTGRPIGALVAVPGTSLLAALDNTALSIIDPAADPAVLRTITLPAPAAAIAPGKTGEILAAAPNRVLRVDAATGAISEIPAEGDLRAVQLRSDGTLLIGTEDGTVRTIDPAGAVLDTVTGLVSADALAQAGNTVTVLDRHQTSITELNLDKDTLGLALRAGDGAAAMIADPHQRLIITDTDGSELLVYTADPLVLRQRFPVGSSPYALAYDQRSDTVWVTCTQSNQIVGFDLSTGIPEEVGRHSTVRQPNSVAIDERTGDLFVGSATGDGLQWIRADQRKRGQ